MPQLSLESRTDGREGSDSGWRRTKSALIMLSFDFCNLPASPHVHRILDP